MSLVRHLMLEGEQKHTYFLTILIYTLLHFCRFEVGSAYDMVEDLIIWRLMRVLLRQLPRSGNLEN